MSEERVPYVVTEAGALALRIAELEKILRHFDRASMDLHHYVRGIERRPSEVEWMLVRDQIAEMVDAYGPRNPNR
jgi:hypothetical protein